MKNKISIDYSIDAGTRYSIDKIFTNIDSVFDKEIFFPLKDEYEKYVGKYYSPFKIKKLLDSIDELVEKNDLQFVEHNVEEIKNEDKISIKLNIFEGEKVLVERINILGNNVTNEDVIRGELEIDEGDPFTKIGLDKSVSNLKSRRLFSQVTSETKDGSEKNLKIIDVKVEEQPTGEISAGAGVGTNGGTFVINISENNWMGEGNRVGFALDVDSESLKGKVISPIQIMIILEIQLITQ